MDHLSLINGTTFSLFFIQIFLFLLVLRFYPAVGSLLYALATLSIRERERERGGHVWTKAFGASWKWQINLKKKSISALFGYFKMSKDG